jgi:hypothetical protein
MPAARHTGPPAGGMSLAAVAPARQAPHVGSEHARCTLPSRPTSTRRTSYGGAGVHVEYRTCVILAEILAVWEQ